MTSWPTDQILDALKESGFAPHGDEWVRGEATAQLDAGWLTLSVPSTRSGPAGQARFGHPGLWKEVQAEAGPRAVFELPVFLLKPGLDDDDEAGAALAAVVQWALTTRHGKCPEDWRSPPADEIKALLPPGALTLQAGGHARQGELIHQSDRLALRLPVLLEVPAKLSPTRTIWLQELVNDAQNRRRLARLALRREQDVTSLQAEVDLTGAPSSVLPALILAGIDALRGVVSWLLPGAGLCADVTVTSRAFETCAPKPATNERTDP